MAFFSTIGNFEIITIPNGAWRQNCYVVRHIPANHAIVIDPGSDAKAIITALKNNGANVQYILITHAHHDHVGAAADICREFDLPCTLHPEDLRLLRHAPMYALRFEGKTFEVPKNCQTFDQISPIEFGGNTVSVIHTPGHTRGSVAIAYDNFIFTGDTLMKNHLGRTDLPGGDRENLLRSVDAICENASPDTVIFPGHGPQWTIGEAKIWLAENDFSTETRSAEFAGQF